MSKKLLKKLCQKLVQDTMKPIKRLKDVLSTPLSLLINQSLCTGIFPEKLKVAQIRPIFKKGDESMVGNYRPVSILPALSKVFEKVVFDQLYKYLTENDLLYSGQYGFRKGHSTELACIEFVDNARLRQITNIYFPWPIKGVRRPRSYNLTRKIKTPRDWWSCTSVV